MPGRTTNLCQPGDRSQLEAEAPVARGFPSVPRERSKRASKPATAFSFESKKEVVHLRAKPVGKQVPARSTRTVYLDHGLPIAFCDVTDKRLEFGDWMHKGKEDICSLEFDRLEEDAKKGWDLIEYPADLKSDLPEYRPCIALRARADGTVDSGRAVNADTQGSILNASSILNAQGYTREHPQCILNPQCTGTQLWSSPRSSTETGHCPAGCTG